MRKRRARGAIPGFGTYALETSININDRLGHQNAHAMTDEQFLGRLARIPALPDDLRAEAGRRHMKLAEQRRRAQRLAWVGTTRLGDPVDAGASAHPDLPGVVALAHAVSNPGRWVGLPRGHSVKTWRAAIVNAVKQIEDRFDAGLAGTLAPKREQGQGTHLRTVKDDHGPLVEILWQPESTPTVPAEEVGTAAEGVT